MKKGLKIFGAVIGLLLLLLILTPILFKGKILERVEREINESVDATVYFERFGVQIFRNFPNLTLTLGDFGVVGKGDFEDIPLAVAEEFRVVVNLRSVLFDDLLTIKRIDLLEPKVYVKVLEDGRPNWDIFLADSETVDEEEEIEGEEFKFRIDRWSITDGHFIYDDDYLTFFMELKGLQHKGSGDFTLSQFDLFTDSHVDELSVRFDGVEYLTKKQLELDMVLGMDLDAFKFTFKENQAKLNDFAFSFDGFFAMPESDMEMDIAFAAEQTDFKNLLSLVPGMFTEDFDQLTTEGELAFDGYVKGIFGEESMPGFLFNLKVVDGFFQYPDLAEAVRNVQVDFTAENKTGDYDYTRIDLRDFRMELGPNPIQAKLLMEDLVSMEVDASLDARLDLSSLRTLFPIEGIDLRGIFSVKAMANGGYDEEAKRMPQLDVAMTLENARIQTAEFPEPLENMQARMSIKNGSGQFKDLRVNLSDFSMKLMDKELTAKALINDLDDINWDVNVAGALDFEQLTKFVTLEGMQLAGLVEGNLTSKGLLSDVENERWERLTTSGEFKLSKFKYEDQDLEFPFEISTARMNFDPQKIELTDFSSRMGSSDFQLNGSINNYLSYILKDDMLSGRLQLKSDLINVNELMGAPEEEVEEQEGGMEVIGLPTNLAFIFTADIKEVIYDDMRMQAMRGEIRLEEGVLRMTNLDFNTLGGSMRLSGAYDPRDLENPQFDFKMGIKDFDIQETFKTFNTVQQLAPVAEKLSGKFSTNFDLAGLLEQDLSPNMSTLIGQGLLNIPRAQMSDSKIISGVNQLKGRSSSGDVSFRDLLLSIEIKEGRAFFEPFDLAVGGQQFTMGGSNGLDGSIDYRIKTTVDGGNIGQAVNQAISSLTGRNFDAASAIKLNFGVTGTYDSPRVRLLSSEKDDSASGQARFAISGAVDDKRQELEDELEKQRQEAEDRARAEAEKLEEKARKEKEEAERKAREEAERLKKEAEERAKEEAEKAKQKAKERVKNIFNN
ncbi:MAG: hypothetical protein LAT68_05985 [Cyclobacteriaceae bacterium]|nr:hypothetical protein [Cyclobacteriaceae bacterium]MCH8515861.1 hypothetical protein [Cyclobacteriaceae bacterium]